MAIMVMMMILIIDNDLDNDNGDDIDYVNDKVITMLDYGDDGDVDYDNDVDNDNDIADDCKMINKGYLPYFGLYWY